MTLDRIHRTGSALAGPAFPSSLRATASSAICGLLIAALAGCASQPQPPQVTPINATVKLGQVTEKTYLSRVDVTQAPSYGGTGVGVGAGGFSGGGGGGVGVGFAFDLSRLFNKQPPPQQVDLFQYKVRTQDGAVASVNAPAAPGLDVGTCVRLTYVDGSQQPQMGPSNEC
ncbi:hypothetical protein C7417_0016 [Cupriavidus plantarum]|uniref:Uncharacterized protein n=1 Tax=Cupriavidus plantarum TaxID=942865 RepID=A0A316EY75_9BURK|nr:hypothetical protein C7419_10116 [Cupriavidus plantarum]REF03092.1 hypothetical protein C7418_1917 [Cupriavidus plantarum]RLK44042.1 hypothetical protein C7417_0016 [Cupriavidus plantarum]CAG2141202.1 hypothetical protein LMG26296_02955 [Cupriavidus plantarum]SMR65252.1 hypothetical protein SAMN05421735_0097 [Cupriavidus plantarum]